MKNIFVASLILFPCCIQAQELKDSAVTLQPINLKLHFANQSLLSVSASSHVLNETSIEQQQPGNLLTGINTVAGIRMEERSPGSYRLAIRGSLIRSPFGIRNTKVYINEFPLTDAGGNTYLNLIDPSFIKQITIIKGPDGSLYGANTGGVIRIDPKGFGEIKDKISVNLSTGSFGLFQQQLEIQKLVNSKYQFAFNQSFLRSDGYRDHSALNKKALQTTHQWQYNSSSQVRLFAFYTDLSYQTPGGLNQTQYDSNPLQARPPAGPNPGAEEQKAAIYNKTIYGGLAHSKSINNQLSHHISLFGSHTDFKNPFITNFEIRKENNIGLRTFFSWEENANPKIFQMQLGAEAILGWNNIQNYDNDKGVPTELQAKDELDNKMINIFYRAQLEILKNWNIEASIGLNNSTINYESNYPHQEKGHIQFDHEWMPRIATTYVLNDMSWRMSYAKGYSTPTLAEVRSSNNIINPNLQAEKGNNYEIGYKVKSQNNQLIFDIAAYTFQMKNGILRQLDDKGVEYYSNVGQMNQKGIEATMWFYIPTNSSVLNAINYQGALAFNHYRFGEYKVDDVNFKGNRITAVPNWVWTNTASLHLLKNYQFNVYHTYNSSSPLNDANSVFANKFNLLQAKISWKSSLSKRLGIQIYAGIDNVLNEKYSLGNDINAFGGRYYNTAAGRNYYLGMKIII